MKINLYNKYKNLKEFILIRKSGLFDEDYYIQTYPDVKNQNISPIMHYIKTGWKEGKNPSPDFDTDYYLKLYPDVRKSGLNPLVHYIRYGKKEGRSIHPVSGAEYQGYRDWVHKYNILTKSDIKNIRAHSTALKETPKFSILLSIKDHQKETLSKAILGLKNQIYPHWELTILSNPSNKDTFEDAFTLICAGDPRCKRIYYQIQDDENAALNSALERCDGDFFIHLQPNQILREHALYLVATAINQHPEVDAIYTDEDKLDQNNQRCSPFFKPDWNPDMFLSQNLFSGLGAFRTDVVKDASGFSKTADVDHNWDLALRIIEKIPASHIRHVPHICVHIKQIQEINKSKPDKDQRYQTLIAHFMRLHIPVEILQTGNQYWHIRFPIPDPQPLVSIIIPTKDQVQLLKVCLESIDYKTTYSNYEILVVNNQSTDPEALAYYDDIKQKEYITLLDYDQPFNYAAINNTAVKHANGDVLIFLNDDTKVISPHWLEELVSHALRKEIGAVGAMLYFPDDSIQHAGIILNPEIIAGHAFYLQPQAFRGQNDRVQYAQNYSAVTAACMAVEKSKFLAVSGFDEENLTIAYNDIDFCLKLVEAGYYNLWTPYAEVYHHESVSRGYDQDIGKHERLQKEANYLRTRWKNKINNDPAYHPNLKGYPLFSLVDPPGVEKPWKDFIAGQH